MAGDIKSEQFLFVREQFVLRPFGQIADGFRHRRRFFLQRAEERALAFLFVGQNARRARQRALDLREQRRARLAEAIARAGFDERFQRFPAQRAAVHALAQFGKRLEFSAFVPRLQNRLDRRFADAFDGGQAESEIAFAVARRARNKRRFRSHPAARTSMPNSRASAMYSLKLVRVRHVVRHHGAEKLHRIIRLQIRGLIGDDGVGGGVRLVEAVAGEFFQQIENLVRLRGGNVVLLRAALDELLALLLPFPRPFSCPSRAAANPPPPSV